MFSVLCENRNIDESCEISATVAHPLAVVIIVVVLQLYADMLHSKNINSDT